MANNSFVFRISAAREEVALSTLTIFCLSTSLLTLFAGKIYRLMNNPEQSSWINYILCDVMLESCSVQYVKTGSESNRLFILSRCNISCACNKREEGYFISYSEEIATLK